MKRLTTALFGAALALGMVSTAQAAPFQCQYRITSGAAEGTQDVHAVDASDQTAALNQTIAWIYQTYGPVGFSVSCSAQ